MVIRGSGPCRRQAMDRMVGGGEVSADRPVAEPMAATHPLVPRQACDSMECRHHRVRGHNAGAAARRHPEEVATAVVEAARPQPEVVATAVVAAAGAMVAADTAAADPARTAADSAAG